MQAVRVLAGEEMWAKCVLKGYKAGENTFKVYGPIKLAADSGIALRTMYACARGGSVPNWWKLPWDGSDNIVIDMQFMELKAQAQALGWREVSASASLPAR